MAGKKISQFTVVTTALTSAYVTLVQSGANVIITMANFLKYYYTRDEIDEIIENIVVGGLTITKVVLADQNIVANVPEVYIHGLSTDDFIYILMIWDSGLGKYIASQTPLLEVNRTSGSVTLSSSESIAKFKLIFIG